MQNCDKYGYRAADFWNNKKGKGRRLNGECQRCGNKGRI